MKYRSLLDVRSSGIESLVTGWLVPDVSGQRVGLIFESYVQWRIIQPLMMGPPRCPEISGSSDKKQYRRRQETWTAKKSKSNYTQVSRVFDNKMLNRMGPWQEWLDWENCTEKNFVICTPQQIFWWQNLGRRDIWGHVARMGKNTKAFEEFWSENLMGRNY